MSLEKDPMVVIGREDFSLEDPRCALEFFAACAVSNRDLAEFSVDPVFAGRLQMDRLREYGEFELERAAVFHSRRDVTEWMETCQVFAEAKRVISRGAELGLADRECAAELESLVERANTIVVTVTRDPSDEDESSAAERWLDPGPDLPLRAARYALEDLCERALEDRSAVSCEAAKALGLIRSLTQSDTLALFERASGVADADADPKDERGRDETLLDALAIRETAGELYALTGNEALLREMERVDSVLNRAPYRNAMFAVSRSRWRLVDERAPSPDHWWGVRTWVEENGPALALRVASVSALERAAIVIKDALAALKTKLAGGWSTAVGHWADVVVPAPRAAFANATAREHPSPIQWTPADDEGWEATLVFPRADEYRADADLSLHIDDLDGIATRVVLCGIERPVNENRATFSYRALAMALGVSPDASAPIENVDDRLSAIAIEVDGVWKVAFLSRKKST